MLKYRILFIYLFLLSFCLPALATNELDSLKHALETQSIQGKKEEIAQTYLEIGLFYFNKAKYNDAIDYFQEGLEKVLYAASNNPKIISFFHLRLADTHAEMSDFPQAVQHYKQTVNIGQYDEEAYVTVIDAWRGMGSLYVNIGDYEQAYSCHLKAIELSKNHADLGHSYYTIGSIYFHQNQLDKALEYYKKALKIWMEKDHKGWIYTCLDAIGVAHGVKEEYEEWFNHSDLALKVAQEVDYTIGIAYGTYNLASYHNAIGCYDEALNLYQKALKKMQKAENKVGEIKVLSSLGNLFIEQGEHATAVFYLKEALSIAQPIGAKPLVQEIYRLLYEGYGKIPNLSLAYQYQDKYITLSDSLKTVNNTERIWAMQIRHELQKQEATINQLQQEQKINELYPKASFVSIGVLLLLGFLLMNRNRLVHIEQELLIQKNKKSQKEREALAKSNRSLEYFATVASDDLQMPLKHIQGLVNNIQTEHQDNLYKEGKEYIHYISDGIERMTHLLTDLLSYAKLDSRKATWKLVKCNVPKLIEEVKRSLVNVIEEKNARINIEYLPSQIKANPTTLALLFQNLISNGIKFIGNRLPIIHLNCVEEANRYVFSVQDNGIGIAEDDQKRIFQIFQRLHTHDEYEGTGIGLATCQKIIQRHKGKIWLESEVGYGTTFYFSISREL